MSVLGSTTTAEPRRWTSRLDGWLLGAAMFLILVGFMSLYSVGSGRGATFFQRQMLNAAVGLIPFSVFFFTHPKVWHRIANVLYAGNVALLGLVLFAGSTTKGAQRWIDVGPLQFQPSELGKLLIVLTLSSYYLARIERIQELGTYLLGLVHVLVPAFLIFRQPHLGATLVVLASWFCISVVAGVRWRHLLTTIGLVAVLVTAVLTVPAISGKLLHGYQKDRILAMSKRDTQGSDWQTWRAEIALGVGGVTGTGFLRGEQKAGGYIPEQQNDFVFTIIGEEGGLIGSTLVLFGFGLFFYRIFLAMVYAADPYYRMVAAGIFAMLGFHTVVNLFMVVQLVPVVGLWLPFLSHGGTALWLCMASVGLLLNIRRQEKPLLF